MAPGAYCNVPSVTGQREILSSASHNILVPTGCKEGSKYVNLFIDVRIINAMQKDQEENSSSAHKHKIKLSFIRRCRLLLPFRDLSVCHVRVLCSNGRRYRQISSAYDRPHITVRAR